MSKTNITHLKVLLFVTCYLLFVTCNKAQTGNPVWSFPPNYWPVGPNPTTALPHGGASNQYPNLVNPVSSIAPYMNYASVYQDMVGPSNMYADASGNPLLFVTNGFVYNAHGYMIDTLADTLTSITSTPSGYWWGPADTASRFKHARQMALGWSEVCIVPNPGNCKQYYIFTAADWSNCYYYFANGCEDGSTYATNGYRPYYALIDMSQSTPGAPTGELGLNITGTLGKPGGTPSHLADLYTATSTTISGCGYSCSPHIGGIQYACTKLIHPSGGGNPYRLLFVTNDLEIIVYQITTTGITFLTNNCLASYSGYFEATHLGYNLGELECYVDSALSNVQVAIEGQAKYGDPGAGLAFANFNMSGGSIGQITSFYSVSADWANISGVEFSPDGSKVYVNGNLGLGYYNWSATPTYTNVGYGTSNASDFLHSQMELGKDGNIYLAGLAYPYGSNTPRLAKITNPNTSPAFTDNVVTLSGGYSYTPKQMVCGYNNTTPTYDTVLYLPDQIDQEVYNNLYTATYSCCLFYTPYDAFTYAAGKTTPTWTTTATTQTWSANTSGHTNNPIALSTNLTSVVTIGEMLRIPAGYTITIRNMTLKFSPQAFLIVENGTSSKYGGNLILHNCTLTVDNVCGLNDMWPGVQVWGTPGSGQTYANQGWLTTDSNTVIENAYRGVLVGCDTTGWKSSLTPVPTNMAALLQPQTGHLSFGSSAQYGGGGVTQLKNSTFLNNQHQVLYNAFTSSASASAKMYECTLKCTKLIASGVSQKCFVGMYGYYPTNIPFPINGCTFVDSILDNYVDTGIYSLNSAYWVDYVSGSTPVRSNFSNFWYAIHSYNTGGNSATITVDHSTFVNNSGGIYLGMVNNATVENDTFKLRMISSHSSGGLYLDNCTGYWVQDNYSTRYSVNSAAHPYGILVSNSGPYVNGIFRNSFNNLYIGTQAQYRNYIGTYQSGNGSGLLYLCNTFASGTMSTADIYVPAIGSGANIGSNYTSTDTASGIGNLQGNISPSGGNRYTADNQFSHTSSGKDFWIENGPYAFGSTYTYYSSSTPNCGTLTAWYPNTVNHLIRGCSVDSLASPDCSTGGNGHTTRTMYVNPITQAMNDANNYKQTYDSLNALIDGGSTGDLLNLINGNNNAQAVYNSLNAATPYLSNAVLKAYLNSAYPASDIRQVLMACSPLSNEINTALNASNMSAGIKTQVASLQTGLAKIDGLNRMIVSAFSSRHLSLDIAIRYMVRTATSDSLAKGDSLLKVKAMELPARVQVETGFNIHDSAMAANALTQVANAEGQSNFVKLNTILLQNLSKPVEQLMKDTSVVSTLQSMATDSSDRLIYLKANILLSTIGLSKYVPYYQPISTTSTQTDARTEAIAPVVSTVVSASTLYNQPNPFKESTVVKAVVAEKTQNAYIVITDMLGNEIGRYPVQQGENNINVNAGGLDQGVMFCNLVVDGVKVKTNKMVLIR